jgi:hypothetical protein
MFDAGSRVTYAYWVHFFEPGCRALPIPMKPIREQDFRNAMCHMLPSNQSTFRRRHPRPTHGRFRIHLGFANDRKSDADF